MAKFCPNCGSEQGPFIKGLCRQCFLAMHRPFKIPDTIIIEKCQNCAKIKVAGKLFEQNNESLEKAVLRAAKITDLQEPKFKLVFLPAHEKILVKIKVSGLIDSQAISLEKQTVLQLRNMQCDSCMKTVSYYHEAIIQLRSKDREKLESAAEKTQELLSAFFKKDSLSRTIDIKKEKNGLDLFIGSKKSASKIVRQLSKKFGVKPVVSFKITGGDKDGNIKKRFSYCLRF